jgi:UDP-N-acetylglucosamine 2-epimerase (non-hydrolysing)
MERFEPVVRERRPDLVLVVGDVNSTVACGLVAVKLGIPLGHVEAGLRSRDRAMPEEINRVVTDAISDLLFASEESGMENLRREGVPEENLCFAGNVMIDTLLRHRDRAEESAVLAELAVETGGYAVLTLHRPSNVDAAAALEAVVEIVEAVAQRLPVVFPVHPRTRARLAETGLLDRLQARRGFRAVEPLGYLDFLKLIAHARVLLTDSGGIQEEATILRVPCLTLRESTERPATVASGFNRVVGIRPETVIAAFEEVLAGPPAGGAPPQRWDGKAGERIAARIAELGTAGLARLQGVRAGG